MVNVTTGAWSRRDVLKGAMVPAIAYAAGDGTLRDAPVRAYFLAQHGIDTNDGRSPATPWRTLDRLNAALAAREIGPGDTVHFRSGEEFFGRIVTVEPTTTGRERLRFIAYGSGTRPRISAYKILTDPSSWESVGRDLWRIAVADSGKVSGNTVANSRVGFLRVNGAIVGAKKFDVSELERSWDFYSEDLDNTGYLYVRLGNNPAVHGDVRCAPGGGSLVVLHSRTELAGLELTGSGDHAVNVPGQGVSDVRITRNRIHEIGGCVLESAGPNVRYGNGVEVWFGSSNVEIDGNYISSVFDVAITYQGTPQHGHAGWRNLSAHRNWIARCSQSFEVWAHGPGTRETGAGFVSCSFTDNYCQSGKGSWGQRFRSNPDVAVHLLFYSVQVPCDIEITRNTFERAAAAYCYFHDSGPPAGLVSHTNDIVLETHTPIQVQRPERVYDADAWRQATGLEWGSTFRQSLPVIGGRELFGRRGF